MKCNFDCVYEMVHHDCSERGCSDCPFNENCKNCVNLLVCKQEIKLSRGCSSDDDCGKCKNTDCPLILPF